MIYVVPVFLILIITYAALKKTDVYGCFVAGGKEGLNLIYTVFPYISAVMILIALFRASGLSDYLIKVAGKPLSYLGIPSEVTELLFLRPLSGNGSLAILESILQKYGADSYAGRVAAVIMGSSETVFYIAAVYFSKTKIKKLNKAIVISLIATLGGAIVAALVCRL